MKKIRIVYTIPNFDTAGSGIALLKMVTRLDKGLYDPIIVCLHNRGKYFENVLKSGVPVFIYPYLTPLQPRWRFFLNIIKIIYFFRSLKADIIFSYHYAPDISEAIAARISGCKFLYIKKNMGWYGPNLRQWQIKTWFSNAITVQNREMIRLFYPNDSRASIISIGVDQDEFKPSSPDIQLKKEIIKDEKQKIILCVANLIPKKGIEFLIRGFYECESYKDSHLLIVGKNDTPLWPDIEKIIQGYSDSSRVHFTGKRDDVFRFYSIADLFILASTGDEGAPIAIQEAMASGIPVITTLTPGNMEQLEELPDQLIPPSDVNSISIAIDKYLNLNNIEKDYIIKKQMSIIEKKYSLKNEVQLHEDLYKTLMGLRN